MSPDSLAVEVVALVATVAAAVMLGIVWGAGRSRSRILIRSAAVATCLATAAATGGIWVNRQVDTYPTWGACSARRRPPRPRPPPAAPVASSASPWPAGPAG
ncbi:hypothetical protein [Paractinoplanes durhamensis]|uniref:hypothetical protein n=1 Tax=Paractinoplanes durhamensis TaxID=113563 RepID=UPI00362D268E